MSLHGTDEWEAVVRVRVTHPGGHVDERRVRAARGFSEDAASRTVLSREMATIRRDFTDSTSRDIEVVSIRELSEGEVANPGFAYRDANGRLLMGPCHDPDCKAASKPGGYPHDGPHRAY